MTDTAAGVRECRVNGDQLRMLPREEQQTFAKLVMRLMQIENYEAAIQAVEGTEIDPIPVLAGGLALHLRAGWSTIQVLLTSGKATMRYKRMLAPEARSALSDLTVYFQRESNVLYCLAGQADEESADRLRKVMLGMGSRAAVGCRLNGACSGVTIPAELIGNGRFDRPVFEAALDGMLSTALPAFMLLAGECLRLLITRMNLRGSAALTLTAD